MTRFADLALLPPLLRAVDEEGYDTPTPIQLQAIPHVLAGKDVLGCAQTGTGKTAAFALPILQRLHLDGVTRAQGARHPRVLVLTPTRELATQIGDGFAAYGRHVGVRHAVIFGGVSQGPQERVLAAGIDVLVATPGRLLDLMGQRLVHLERVSMLVLDEADRMLDMGFIHDVRRVLEKVPKERQTLLFSATMPPDIRALASAILRSPVTVAVVPPATTAERIEQSVYLVERTDKRPLLEHLLRDPSITRALVFTRTKHGANRVAESLRRVHVAADVIHGNKSQNARERALAHFKDGRLRVLVATDIAGRGIDIEDVSHVINFDLPNVPEAYVHRIGRTARAGAAGIAIAFCESEERPYLIAIEQLTGVEIPVVEDHPYRSPNR
ncbi:MAG: DEAD/DEAH box helicase, partial [Deltaproteobacteria bacterium]|nr:DEAD/DEAH box helicase [Deltaproteobacteria bacterium]